MSPAICKRSISATKYVTTWAVRTISCAVPMPLTPTLSLVAPSRSDSSTLVMNVAAVTDAMHNYVHTVNQHRALTTKHWTVPD
ncbi:hypothetical protein DPMN_189583 [Dreissena polymorpha]|uniref:Uncharacterized protein n=1 Tax=Dreissena polymorpha TaxID=45954 RepID=A0A9D4DTE9_DREPO|nr:hypothetical protein DPMN_189583 [Dreissena polymorpha]